MEHLEKVHENFSRCQNVLCKEHWISLGYSEEESVEMARNANIQRTQDIPLYVRQEASKKSRETIGEERLVLIHKKQSESMKRKNGHHSPCFKEYWMDRGYSEHDARLKSNSVRHENSNYSTISKVEKKCLDELQEYLGIEIERSNWVTIDNKVLCQDGRYNNIVFEFNGTNFHLDKRFHDKTSKDPYGRTFDEIKRKDDDKLEKYKSNGYNTIVIWQYDYEKNKNKLFYAISENIRNNFNGKTGMIIDSSEINQFFV